MSVRIVSAVQAEVLLPRLAAWHFAEWSAYFPGWSQDDAWRELQSHAKNPAGVPTTLVAIDDAHSGSAEPLGSVSLLLEDSPELAHLDGPWLASLFVAPDARGSGLGTQLVHAVIAHARTHGVAALRLFTPSHRGFYEALGWQFETEARCAGKKVAVMRIALR